MYDDSESEPPDSSSDDDLFLENDDNETDLPSTSKGNGRLSAKGTSFRRTNKLNVGILEGTTFLNNYIVVDTLGRGSFGKVKLCLSIENDSLYAVKVVDKRLIKQVAKSRHLNKRFGNMKPTSHGNAAVGSSSTKDHLEDLRREVDIMRALNHPNLVKLYEVIDDKVSGKILMVVEFCEAGALVSPGQLTPERRMPEAIAQFYFRQMVSGIAYLHENSVIHGDMKPENVLLAGDATVKIADFGQSQFMSGGEDTLRRTLGTPAFLAPEICAGEDYRGRPADVWALGVSLYGFIYGELPFKGESLMELYEDIAEATVPFPSNVSVSMELQDLLLRILHKDPEARITAAEMLTHPWVREDDLFTLMPSLFSEEAMMEGIGASAFGGHVDGAGVSPRGQTSPKVAAAAGGSNPGDSVLSDGGDASASTSAHGSRTVSDASSLPPSIEGGGGGGGGGGGAPSPADVAAAVFPSLFSTRRSTYSDGSFGKRSGKEKGGVSDDEASTRARSLVPQQSIIGALQEAQRPYRLAAHPSENFHLLATDSMVRKSLHRIDSSDDDLDAESGDDGGGSKDDRDLSSNGKSAGSDYGTREQSMEQQDTGRPSSFSSSSSSLQKNRKGKKVKAVPKVEAAIDKSDGGGGGAPQHTGQVELSKPSVFTVMAQQAQQIQAELLAKQNNLNNSSQSSSSTTATSVPTSRAQSGALETIGEEETDGIDTSLATESLNSMISMPSGSYEIIDPPVGFSAELPPLPPITEDTKEETFSNLTQNRGSKGRVILGKLQKTSSVAIPSTSSSGVTEITWTTSNGVQQSSQSLTFGSGGESSLPIASPFDTIGEAPKPKMNVLNKNSNPGGDNNGNSSGNDKRGKKIETAADVVKTASAAASPPLTATEVEEHTACEIQEEEEEEDNPSSSPVASTSPSRNKMFNLLQRISFRGGGESTAAEPRQEAESTLSTPLLSDDGTSKPLPQPPQKDPTMPAIQWQMYRPGQKLHFQMTSQSRSNTVYYIESGMVELRWEATLAVPLTRVLSTMQYPGHKYGTATGNSTTPSTLTASGGDRTGEGGLGNSVGTTSRPLKSTKDRYMNRIDSVALAANKVTTLRPGSAGDVNPTNSSSNSRDGPTSGIDRSETMANTLQQAAERAEALMVNAAGGSLDNLLLSHRGASQFVGALSLLDPDYFADRWKATSVAQTDLVVIQMTRAGLDEFLAQNPLAQVHLRASMARGQAEITKLEALERIAEAHRRKRYSKQALRQGQRKPSWKISDIKGAFGVSFAEAAEAAGLGGPTGDLSRLTTMKQGRDGDASAQETAGLDVFALVSKLRNEI